MCTFVVLYNSNITDVATVPPGGKLPEACRNYGTVRIYFHYATAGSSTNLRSSNMKHALANPKVNMLQMAATAETHKITATFQSISQYRTLLKDKLSCPTNTAHSS
jgi:hypothetical protein